MQTLSEELSAVKAQLISLVNSIDPKDTDRVPFEGSWTAGQVLEHTDKAVSPQILSGNTAPVDRPADKKAGLIKKIFLDFDTKFKSPEFIEPTASVHDKDQLRDSLVSKFDALIHAAQTMNLEEECLDFEVPGMGKFTRLEWITFYMVHTQRHLQQLANINAVLQGK